MLHAHVALTCDSPSALCVDRAQKASGLMYMAITCCCTSATQPVLRQLLTTVCLHCVAHMPCRLLQLMPLLLLLLALLLSCSVCLLHRALYPWQGAQPATGLNPAGS
jgi:hypothetical protein